MKSLSKKSNEAVLAVCHAYYREELVAAVKNNPGLRSGQARQLAAWAAFMRLVRVLESSFGLSGTLDDTVPATPPATCNAPDRHEPKLICGYPLPCPHHTSDGGRIIRVAVLAGERPKRARKSKSRARKR